MQVRPKIKLQLATTDRLLEVSGWTILCLLWILTVYQYQHSPAIIPVHFDGIGHPNAYGHKSSLFQLPVVASILFIGMTILNRYPHIFNYPTPITEENALMQYAIATRMIRFLKLVIVIVFSALVWLTGTTASGKTNGLGVGFLLLMFVLIFLPVVYFVVKAVKSK